MRGPSFPDRILLLQSASQGTFPFSRDSQELPPALLKHHCRYREVFQPSFRHQECRDWAAHELPRSPAESGRKGCLPAHRATGTQSCSTPEPLCSPAGPTFLQRKGHFHSSQQKVPACKPAHRLARAPWRLHSAHRRISHCPQQSLTGREVPGQHFSPEELPLLTGTVSQACSACT